MTENANGPNLGAVMSILRTLASRFDELDGKIAQLGLAVTGHAATTPVPGVPSQTSDARFDTIEAGLRTIGRTLGLIYAKLDQTAPLPSAVLSEPVMRDFVRNYPPPPAPAPFSEAGRAQDKAKSLGLDDEALQHQIGLMKDALADPATPNAKWYAAHELLPYCEQLLQQRAMVLPIAMEPGDPNLDHSM